MRDKEMFSGYQTEAELIQNMLDAGCAENIIDGVISCLKNGQTKKGLSLLQEQRAVLLDEIHRNQSCIRYLDEVLCEMQAAFTGSRHLPPNG